MRRARFVPGSSSPGFRHETDGHYRADAVRCHYKVNTEDLHGPAFLPFPSYA